MTLRSQVSGVVAAVVLAVSCSSITGGDPVEKRLQLENLTVQSTVVSGEPLPVYVRYEIAACDEVTSVSGQWSAANRLEVEVRGRRMPMPPNYACVDALYSRDTSLAVIAPQPGILTVVGLRLGDPIERSVTVSSPN